MDQGCVDCAAEVDHCHGTLVRHRDYLLECAQSGCTVFDPARHHVTVDCEFVDGTCMCSEEFPVELRLAS